MAQEALSNVRRHASARNVTLTVSYMPDVTVLDVQDDGHGFDTAEPTRVDRPPTGVGLHSMRERVEELGGTLVVESVPGEGTTVAATLPVDPGPAEPVHPERDVRSVDTAETG